MVQTMPEAKPPIHGIIPFVPASKLVEATGEALAQIKREDGLTWGDIGEAIGRSEDQAAKYGSALASMDFVTFLRACQRWNGRFSVAATMLGMSILPAETQRGTFDARRGKLGLTLLLADLQAAMLDGELSPAEMVEMDVLIEQADRFLEHLKLHVAAEKAARAERRES